MKKILTVMIILLVTVFTFKGCIKSAWVYPDTITTYSTKGSDGQNLSIVFYPEGRTIFYYNDPSNQYAEVTTASMKGLYGTHYWGQLWSIYERIKILGLRFYPNGTEPVLMEVSVLDKYVQGDPSNSPLPEKGGTINSVVLFSDDAINFENIWLSKTEM